MIKKVHFNISEDVDKHFTTRAIKNIFYVNINSDISKSVADVFEVATSEWINKNEELHVLDFKLVENIHSQFYRFIINYQQSLKNSGKKCVSLNVSKTLEEQLNKSGVKATFNVLQNVNELMKTSTKQKTLDKFSEAISTSMLEALKKLLKDCKGFVPSEKVDKVKLSNSQLENFNFSAIIPFQNDVYKGDIRVNVDKKNFLEVYNFMLNKEVKQVDPLVMDFMKEFLNILIGEMQSTLTEDKIDIGLPIVYNWSEIKNYVNIKKMDASLIYLFEINGQEIELNLNLSNVI